MRGAKEALSLLFLLSITGINAGEERGESSWTKVKSYEHSDRRRHPVNPHALSLPEDTQSIAYYYMIVNSTTIDRETRYWLSPYQVNTVMDLSIFFLPGPLTNWARKINTGPIDPQAILDQYPPIGLNDLPPMPRIIKKKIRDLTYGRELKPLQVDTATNEDLPQQQLQSSETRIVSNRADRQVLPTPTMRMRTGKRPPAPQVTQKQVSGIVQEEIFDSIIRDLDNNEFTNQIAARENSPDVVHVLPDLPTSLNVVKGDAFKNVHMRLINDELEDITLNKQSTDHFVNQQSTTHMAIPRSIPSVDHTTFTKSSTPIRSINSEAQRKISVDSQTSRSQPIKNILSSDVRPAIRHFERVDRHIEDNREDNFEEKRKHRGRQQQIKEERHGLLSSHEIEDRINAIKTLQAELEQQLALKGKISHDKRLISEPTSPPEEEEDSDSDDTFSPLPRTRPTTERTRRPTITTTTLRPSTTRRPITRRRIVTAAAFRPTFTTTTTAVPLDIDELMEEERQEERHEEEDEEVENIDRLEITNTDRVERINQDDDDPRVLPPLPDFLEDSRAHTIPPVTRPSRRFQHTLAPLSDVTIIETSLEPIIMTTQRRTRPPTTTTTRRPTTTTTRRVVTTQRPTTITPEPTTTEESTTTQTTTIQTPSTTRWTRPTRKFIFVTQAPHTRSVDRTTTTVPITTTRRTTITTTTVAPRTTTTPFPQTTIDSGSDHHVSIGRAVLFHGSSEEKDKDETSIDQSKIDLRTLRALTALSNSEIEALRQRFAEVDRKAEEARLAPGLALDEAMFRGLQMMDKFQMKGDKTMDGDQRPEVPTNMASMSSGFLPIGRTGALTTSTAVHLSEQEQEEEETETSPQEITDDRVLESSQPIEVNEALNYDDEEDDESEERIRVQRKVQQLLRRFEKVNNKKDDRMTVKALKFYDKSLDPKFKSSKISPIEKQITGRELAEIIESIKLGSGSSVHPSQPTTTQRPTTIRRVPIRFFETRGTRAPQTRRPFRPITSIPVKVTKERIAPTVVATTSTPFVRKTGTPVRLTPPPVTTTTINLPPLSTTLPGGPRPPAASPPPGFINFIEPITTQTPPPVPTVPIVQTTLSPAAPSGPAPPSPQHLPVVVFQQQFTTAAPPSASLVGVAQPFAPVHIETPSTSLVQQSLAPVQATLPPVAPVAPAAPASPVVSAIQVASPASASTAAPVAITTASAATTQTQAPTAAPVSSPAVTSAPAAPIAPTRQPLIIPPGLHPAFRNPHNPSIPFTPALNGLTVNQFLHNFFVAQQAARNQQAAAQAATLNAVADKSDKSLSKSTRSADGSETSAAVTAAPPAPAAPEAPVAPVAPIATPAVVTAPQTVFLQPGAWPQQQFFWPSQQQFVSPWFFPTGIAFGATTKEQDAIAPPRQSQPFRGDTIAVPELIRTNNESIQSLQSKDTETTLEQQ